MSLKQLLADRGIGRALVVDDACDAVPTAADLELAGAEWSTFFDDLQQPDWEVLERSYPGARAGGVKLQREDNFVAAVWASRSELGATADELFRVYVSNSETDREYVQVVTDTLESLGVEVTTRGRDFVDAVADADLVVIDLYLGANQDEQALATSKTSLAEAVRTRRSNPPLVILMSRSEYLTSRREEFRDEVGLLDSGFRIIHKNDLLNGPHLERRIERLASSATDTKRLAVFLDALTCGVEGAVERSVALMRRMRLSDVGQIKGLLLEVEGAPTGSYLVDVFDRLLQHEIEADSGIITSAQDLNKFSLDENPPPYVAGSPDLQALVARMLNQNSERLALPGAVDAVVGFGDLIRRTPGSSGGGAADHLWEGLGDDGVLFVMTPACDLQRNGAPRVLLLAGKVHRLTPRDWSYASDARTPAIEMDGSMHWIRWSLKHLETASADHLRDGIHAKQIRVVGRLRESHALNLQQRVLSNLGRVGVVSSLPATFAVDVEVYVPNSARSLTLLPVAELADPSVVFIGRDRDGKPQPRLVLTEDGCDGLMAAVGRVGQDSLARNSQKVIGHVQTTTDLLQILARGLALRPRADEGGWSPIKAPEGSPRGIDNLGHVFWGTELTEKAEAEAVRSKAGLLLVIRETHQRDAPALAQIRRMAAQEINSGDEEHEVILPLD